MGQKEASETPGNGAVPDKFSTSTHTFIYAFGFMHLLDSGSYSHLAFTHICVCGKERQDKKEDVSESLKQIKVSSSTII
jgi:hypothetical protein